MITDLTAEHPKKTLWRFALPMFISVMFQPVFNNSGRRLSGRVGGGGRMGEGRGGEGG